MESSLNPLVIRTRMQPPHQLYLVAIPGLFHLLAIYARQLKKRQIQVCSLPREDDEHQLFYRRT